MITIALDRCFYHGHAIRKQDDVGRTGLVASCLLIAKGLDPEGAVDLVSANRRATIPDTQAQREWIDSYARALAAPLLG